MNTKNKGDISEAYVLLKLLEAGKTVLQPFGDNQKYDLVVDEDGVFVRIQVKTARMKNSSLKFNAYSVVNGVQVKEYHGSIDYFAVYSPELNQAYLIPIDDVTATEVTLQVVEPTNSYHKNVKKASDYLIEDACKNILRVA